MRFTDLLLVRKSGRGRSRGYVLIPIACALLFHLLKWCFPESSSCVTSPLPFFFSWPLWNKWSQRRNCHFPCLSELTYILLQGQEGKRRLPCFHRSARRSWSYAFTGSLSKAFPFLQQSPGVGEAVAKYGICLTKHSRTSSSSPAFLFRLRRRRKTLPPSSSWEA